MSSGIKLPPSQRILRAIRLLAVLAVSGGALAFGVTHFAFPRVGFEGMLVLAGLAIWFSILCIAVAFALGCFILLRRRGFPIAWPLVCCAAAGLLIVLTVRKL
jgi:cation transporter-like permease